RWRRSGAEGDEGRTSSPRMAFGLSAGFHGMPSAGLVKTLLFREVQRHVMNDAVGGQLVVAEVVHVLEIQICIARRQAHDLQDTGEWPLGGKSALRQQRPQCCFTCLRKYFT